MTNKEFILLNQKIPESQKNLEWDKCHAFDALNFIGYNINSPRKKEQLECWNAFYGIIDDAKEKQLLTLTNPYGLSLGIPYMRYPLIESKIEQMVGEFLTRPIIKNVYVTNKEAKSKKLDAMYNMVTEEILREVNKELETDLGFVPDTQNPDMELPEDVDAFIKDSNYKTESEKISNIILNQVIEVKKGKDQIRNLFIDWLVQDQTIAFVDEKDGHPSITRLDNFETDMDWNPNEEITNDPQWLLRHKYCSYNEILNSFDLTKEEEQILRSYDNYKMNGNTSYNSTGYDAPKSYNNNSWFYKNDGFLRVRLLEVTWISKREIKVLVSKSKKTGKEFYKILPEDYNKKKKNVQKIWVDYKRRVLMAGPDLVLFHGPIEERYGYIDDIKKDTIEAVGIRRNNPHNAPIRSIPKKLIQLEDFASEILFEIKLAARRNNGKVFVYDTAQTPKQYIKSAGYHNAINRVNHHIKKDQMILINSSEKNFKASFNQFSSIDLSAKGIFQELFGVLGLLEDLSDKFIGLSQERQGQVDKYQTRGGTERAVAQSNARSEVFISPFESFLESLMHKILLKGKYVYEENETVQFVFGDIKEKFFKIYPSFFSDDIGVAIKNGYKHNRAKENIDRAAEQLFTNAQTPDLILSLIKVLNSETADESEEILKKGINALEKLREENLQAQQEQAKMQQEVQDKENEKELKIKREEFQNNIDVANIKENGETSRNNKKLLQDAQTKIADLEKELLENNN